MRMFFLLFLLFIPIPTLAVNCELDESQCKITPGCSWNSPDCVECKGSTDTDPHGYYCPGNTNGVAQPCPAPFTSSFVGATEIGGCFAEMTCDNTDVKAGVSYTTATEFILAPIVNNGFWNFDDPSNTWPANNQNMFYNQFHLETNGSGTNVRFTCESNTQPCDNFTTNNGQCELLSNLNATWVDDETGGYWNVSLCKCSTDSAVISDKKCTGVQTLSAIEGQTNVTHVGDIIEFDSNPDSYYCTSCIADDASHVYYADTNATGCVQGHVCACAELTTKGWVRTGNCGGNQNWQNQSDICVIQPCPLPGQTTDSIGGQCTYGSATKICDSTDHCVSLPAGNWTAIQ